jgi:hypothetical protein
MSRVPRPNPPSTPEPEEPEDLEEDEEGEEMDFGDDDMMDPMEALGSFLATEDGDTIATALVGLKDATEKIALSLEMQNKILVKILSAMSKPTCSKPCVCTPTEAA